MFTKNLLLISVCTASLMMTGCATKKIANSDVFDSLANEKAEQFAGDSEKALNDAENAYTQAKKDELDFYAPLHMQELRDTLKKARTVELEGNADETIRVSAKVMALAEAGLKNKQKVEALLPALITQKNTLDEIKANNILPSDYQSAMDDFKELISLIEAGEETKATQGSQAVLAELQELELNTMLAQHWQPAKDTLDKAEDEDADSNAVKTYEYAEQLVDTAERQIRQNYTDRELTAKTGKDALRAAQHALFIGREVTTLVKMNSAQAEDVALKFEDYLGDIGAAIRADDVRHMSLQDQTLALKQYAEEQNEKVAAQYKKQIADLNGQLEKLLAQQIAANSQEAEKEMVAEAPAEPVAEKPAEPVAEAPAEHVAETPAEPVAETPAEPVAETPAEPVAETPAEPAVETPAEPVAETPAEPAVETPAEPVAETPAKPVAETPAEPVAETPAKPVAETPVEPVAEAPAKPVAETQAEPVAEAPAEPVAETSAEPVSEAPADPEPVVEAPEPAAEPVATTPAS